MSSQQYRLFEYTKANELLIGNDVIKADKVKRIVKSLQARKKLADNGRLDAYYRDTTIIDDVIVIKIDPVGAVAAHEKYAIAIVINPVCIRVYAPPIAFFEYKEDADAMLDTVRAYLTYRYGV